MKARQRSELLRAKAERDRAEEAARVAQAAYRAVIHELIETGGATQSELAAELGVTRQRISKLLQGGVRPTL